jgi:hypothetical protein
MIFLPTLILRVFFDGLTSFTMERIQRKMVVGVNLLSLRIEGGGTRHFAESLLLEFTSPPFNRRHLLLAFCLPELEAHVKSLFAAATNASIVVVESIDQIQKCSDLCSTSTFAR